MATYLGTGAVFQIMSGATAGNVNGGGFNLTNPNFPTDGVIAGGTSSTPTITPTSSYAFVTLDATNGAWVFFPVQTGVTFPTWAQITSVAGGVATLAAGIGQCVQVVNNMFVTNTTAGIASTTTPTLTYGVDYSQQTVAQYSNSALTGTTTSCTDVTNPFTSNMIGNFITIASGTGVTAGFYEITNVVTGTATLDRSAGTSYSLGVCKIGGAVPLGGSTTGITDILFSQLGASSTVNPTRFFIKGGAGPISYSLASTFAPLSGTTRDPVFIEGYNSIRGDRPTGATRPILAAAANTVGGTGIPYYYSLGITGTGASVATSAGGKYFNCSATNTSTTAGRNAFSLTAAASALFSCEGVSYRGNALAVNAGGKIHGCYFHDSNQGVVYETVDPNASFTNNIVACNVSGGFLGSIALTAGDTFIGNTFYGAENKLGTAVSLLTGTTSINFYNNIIYGFTTGVTHADTNNIDSDNYNCYFNNTTDVSNWQKGSSDIAVNPSFTAVAQVTGTTATSSTTTLTDSGKNFTTAGVVAGRDFLQIISGTGATAGIYGIVSVGTTTLTTDISLGTISANGTYQITTGRNFAVGTALKATGYPGAFPAGFTTGYIDIGAAQRQEAAGGSGGSFTFGC